MDHEQWLTGGNTSGIVTRVGSTVRKQWVDSTPSVHAFMKHVRGHGVDVPAVVGQDPTGRQVVEYVPGILAIDADPLTREELRRVGAMVRAIHDASESFAPSADAGWETAIAAPGADLVCHNDLAPWNLVVGDRWVFIDWDAAAPSTRLWDLAYSAQSFALSRVRASPHIAAGDLRAFVDGYGADGDLRTQLPEMMRLRATAMLDLLSDAHENGREPWASMFADGHGSHWADVVDYVGAHAAVWLDALTAPPSSATDDS